MYNAYIKNSNPCFINTPFYNPSNMYDAYNAYLYNYCVNMQMYNAYLNNHHIPYDNGLDYSSKLNFLQDENSLFELKDYGPELFVVNINEVTKQNNTYRTTLWTGSHFQLTLMSLNSGEDIGLEMHSDLDQFIRIEEGQGIVAMGDSKDNLNYIQNVYDDFAFIIPAGKWHNLTNTGSIPLKLYSIYAPPQHPKGTVHETKADSEADE